MLRPIFARRQAPASSDAPTDTDAILRQLAPDVRGWVFRYLGARAELDDVVQEALIELASALARFRGDSSVRTYARRIVTRVASRHVRTPAGQARVHLVPDAEYAPDPETIAMQRESLRRLYGALAELSETRRSAFVLCAIERLPHDEVAAIEQVSVETLRARLKRARAELADRLRDDPLLAPLFRGGGHE